MGYLVILCKYIDNTIICMLPMFLPPVEKYSEDIIIIIIIIIIMGGNCVFDLIQ